MIFNRCHVCGRIIIFGGNIDGPIHLGTCRMTAMGMKMQRMMYNRTKAIIKHREDQIRKLTGDEPEAVQVIVPLKVGDEKVNG